MTTIVELPTEPKFTIKTVASQTGIRPVTLRAWERRHEILTPYRSDNHYRLYSERDIAILRWLKFRVDEGMSIRTAVSELRSMASRSIWPEAVPLVPTQQPNTGNIAPVTFSHQLSRALIRHEENHAGDVLREAHAGLDLVTVCMEVLAPAVEQVEDAWYRGDIGMDGLRFANAYLRGKLLSLLQAYPSRHSAPLVLVGCAPMEVHELHALMLAVLLRSHGFRVEYLGPDINIDDLADYATYELPSLVVLWANSPFTAREMRRMQEKLKKVRTTPLFAYSGCAFVEKPALTMEIPGAYLGNTLEIALGNVKNILKSRKKAAAN